MPTCPSSGWSSFSSTSSTIPPPLSWILPSAAWRFTLYKKTSQYNCVTTKTISGPAGFPPTSPFPPPHLNINPAVLFNPFLASAYAQLHSGAGTCCLILISFSCFLYGLGADGVTYRDICSTQGQTALVWIVASTHGSLPILPYQRPHRLNHCTVMGPRWKIFFQSSSPEIEKTFLANKPSSWPLP